MPQAKPQPKPNSAPRSCWLVKSEPDCFSIHDLAASPRQTTCWDGVRNYQARNFLRAMRVGDPVLFYHSSADPPAVAGRAVVVAEAYADSTAWDPRQDHYDPKAGPDNPIWQMVDLRLEEIFAEPLGLDRLRAVRELAGMELLRKGSRLSVQPVTPAQLEKILELAREAKKGSKKPSRPQKKPPRTRE
jgi:predicted RNA-binding protein with PUA-like domain